MPRRMTIGQLLIQRALPEDLRDPNRVLDKEGLGELMKTLATRDPDQYRKTTYELQRVGAEIAYRAGGASFGLRHLAQTEGMKQRRKELEAQIQKVLTDDEVPREEKRGKIADMLRDFVKPEQDAVMKESLENKNPLALQVVSGARGSAGNMMSLLGGDAMYVDANDEPIPIAVLRGFAQGLRPAEYWAATYGARKSVIETKLGVQNAGDLGKQLTRAAHRAMIVGLDRDGDEPTLRGLPVDTDDSDNEGALLAAPAGRFERNTILTRQHLDELKKAGINRILLRSPAVSQTEEGGVWARDVGVREFGRLPRQGEFVGITAAQALCLAEGTSVRMADGRVKAIEAVRPGELVLGSDTAGVVRPVRVLSLFENGEKDCVEYAFRRGTGAVSSENILKLVCTPEHKLLSEIVIRSGSPDSKYFEPIAIRPVGTTLRNRHDAFCARLSQRFDDSGYRDEPFAMLIGVLIGDGCYTGDVSSGGVSLSCHDQKQIKDLSEFYAEYGIEFVPQTTPGEYRVTDTTASQPKKRQDGSFYRNRVVEWLKTRGMWGAYSHEKKLPPDVHDWSNKSILELLGGLIATDGYVVEATGAIGFSSTSREMLEQVRDLLGIRFGISCASLCEKQKKKADGSQHRSCYALMVCSVQDIRKLEGLLRIPGRKAALLHSVVSRRADSVGNDSRRCRLVSATPVGTRRTFDLYVEHPDHLFVLENGLVVSNSEPLAQATLGAKHGGGAATGARGRSGFAYIDQLAQVPKVFPGGAAHAEKDGNISSIEKAPAGGYYIGIGDKKHYVPADQKVTVNYGDSVEAGDVLSDGIPNPAKIVRLKGLGEGRRYFISAFRQALRNSNIKANRRNVELVTGRLLNHVELDDEVGDFVPGDIVPYSAIEAKWEPRTGFQTTDPRASVGRFLERPYLHYTIGTRITPRVAKELEEFGLSRVDTHDQPPPFQPEMIRAETNLQYDPDWLSRFLGVNLKSNLLKAVPRGGTSDTQSTSYVPALAQAKDFGRTGLIRTPDSSPPQEFEMPKPPPSAEFKPQAIAAPKMPEVPKAPAMPKAAPTVKSSAQAELSGLGLCKLAANPFSRFKGTGFGKAMSGLPGMGGGMSLPTMPGPSLKTPAPPGGMRLGQPIKAPAVPSVPTSPTGGLVNSLRTHQNKLVNVGLAGTAGLAGYQALKPPPLVQGPSTDPALETVRAAMPTARAPQQAVQQAATQTEGVQQTLAPAAKDPTGFLLGRAFHNEELPAGMTVPRDQRESLLTLVSGQDGLRQSLLRPRALSGRELPQADSSQVADRLLMRSRQTLAGRNPYGVDLRQNTQAPGGHALYAAPGNIATNPYVGINPEAAARRAGGKSPTDWSNPGQHPLAILNHELEHTRQDPAATVQAGGISLSHEVPAGLGDLMFSGETTRKTLNDLYPGTGAGQRALQDIPITYPGGKANQLDWMVNMAKQHGYFDGRSMTDLLNTPQGRQYLRQIVESARQVPVMIKENAEGGLSRLRRLKKADETTDALVAAQAGDDGQRSALSGDPNNPYANPMGLQVAMGLYPELPGLLQNLGPLGLAAYGALLSPTDMASLVSGALPKSIRDKILTPAQQPGQPAEEPAIAEVPDPKPVSKPAPVSPVSPVSPASHAPSHTPSHAPPTAPAAEVPANGPADPLRADPPVRTQPPGRQGTIDPALAKSLRARGIKIRPADTAKRIWGAGGGRLLDSFHNEIDQRILNQFSPETLAGMSHDQLRYLASTITDPQGVKQKTRPVAAPRPGQPVGMGDLKAREGNAQEPNPLYVKEQEQLRRMFNSEAAAKRLGPALNDPKALAAALANEQQELRRSMTPGSNLQVGWQDLYPGTDEAAYRANPQFKADVDRYDQMSSYLKNWDPSEPLDPRQVPGLGEYLEARTAGGLTPENPDFRAWALTGGDSPNYGWIRDPIDPGEPVNFLKAVNDYHAKQELQRRSQRKDVDTRTDPSMIWHGVDIGGSSAAADPYARHMTMERLALQRGEKSPLQIAARSLDDYEKGIQAQDGVTDSFLQSPFAQSLPGFGTMGKNWGKTPAQERLAQTQQLSDHLFGLTSERTLKIPDAQLLPLAQKIVQNPDFQSQYQQAGEPIPQPAALLDDLRVGLSRQAVDHALGRPQQYNDNPGYMLSQLGEAANPLVQQISQGATQAAASKLRWRNGKLMGLDLITAPFLAAARTIGAVPGVQETQEVLSGIPLLGGAAVGAARDYANSDNYTPEQLKQMGYNPKQRLAGGLADITAAPGRLIDRNLGTRVTWDNPSERARWAATGSSWLEANRSREGTQNFARQMARQERELANITQQLQAMTPDQRGQWVEQMSSTPNGAAAVKQLAEYERANRQGIGSIQRTALMGDKYPEAMKAFRQNLPTILERSGYQFNPKSQMSDMDWDHLAYSMATGLIPPEFKSALTPDKLDVNQLFGGHLGGAAQSGWAGRQLGWGYGALTSGIPMVLDATSSMATIPKTTPIPGTGVRAALGQGYNALPGPVRNAVQGAFPTGQALTSTNALGVAGQQVAQGATPSLLHSATSMMRGTPQLGERPIFRPKLVPLAKGPAKPTTPSPTTPPAVAGRNNLPGS